MNARDIETLFHPFRRPSWPEAVRVFSIVIGIFVATLVAQAWLVITAFETDTALLYLGMPLVASATALCYALLWITDRATDVPVPQEWMPKLRALRHTAELDDVQREQVEVWIRAWPTEVKYSHVRALEKRLLRLSASSMADVGISA